MAHTHPVVDSDSRFVINSTTRVISTTSDKLELIQGDHQSERITFEIPKIVEGHDMSLCDRIEVHYINIDRRTSATSRDVYIADDVAVDGDKLTFSWLISGNATKYYGRLNFIILFECLDPDGNYTYKWNTEICKLLTIGEGISNTSAVIEDHSDILEKFRKEILEEAGEKSIQPDWNQNDETALDYVKNRPFYTGVTVETVLVEESTVSFAPADGVYMGKLESTFVPTVGETYKVSWDGIDYECTCIEFDSAPLLGNINILFGVPDPDGEPFAIGTFNGVELRIITSDTSASHTFSISGRVPEVVKIDEKYLPDTVATKPEVETAQAIANNAHAIANSARIAADSAQTTSETARATANKARTTANKAQTTAERAQTSAETAQTTAEAAQTNAHNAQTTANMAVKPSKQLEDGCSYHMYNPYADYKSTNVVIGTLGGTSLTIEVNKEQYPSVAFVPPVYGSNQADFEFRRATAEYPHPLITGIGGIVVYSSTPESTKKFRITVDDDYNVSATNTSDSVSKALATTEYVDNSVSNPLNITSATVGQIAKITAVDDSGKPTAWSPADMPSGGADGVTPHIGDNGNWYIGSTDTGKPSRGATGAQGEKGDPGATYVLTDADKAEIVQLVIAQLGGQPIFGTVDSSGNITVSGNLADGTYTVAYTLADGTTINVGSFTIGGETPSYTNLYHSATASINKRVNSSGVLVDANGYVTTDYIAVSDLFGSSPITIYGATNAESAEHTAYIKGATFYNTANCCIAFCNSSKGQVGRFAANSANVKTYAGESGDIDWAKMFNTDSGNNLTNVAYIRFCVKYSDSALQAAPSDIIITVDEAIE